ncbi:MAG: hypothetical protein J4F41_02910 [Alphaproteobacteria bacterium]|nr:hypothetical protein [Alphaproteobacteria bacterium]
MDMINALIAQFYAIPMVDNIVQSNAILRLAVKQFGTPLFVLVAVFILLMLVLVLSRLKPKAGRPKPIREKKAKPAKAPRKPKPAKAPRDKKTPPAILKKLSKIKPSPLPLYPVADKRKPLEMEMDHDMDHDMGHDMGVSPVAAVMDDASLAEGLALTSAADEPAVYAPAPAPVMESGVDPAPELKPASPSFAEAAPAPVPSFTIDEKTPASLMAPQAPKDDEFDMPEETAAPEEMPPEEMPPEPMLQEPMPTPLMEVADDDLDFSDLDLPETGAAPPTFQEPALHANNRDDSDPDRADFDPVPSLDFDPIEAPEPEPRPETGDDDSDLDIPVASFGSGDPEGLSSTAQEKLAELNNRGVT